ncbi:Fungal trans [Geosmithia morbida]|uniref:Fungal trans n=1 Tax=Geosmithia morbida TaxID=1094350 RepID=A0A9P4YVK0_9HYPO|nr:Fungal trans [Geosmithia morbida]KAF4122830.1 Fungal trans [Geosmithia morbida]
MVVEQTDRILWPRFLSRLREAFFLDLQTTTPEAHDMMAMQARITGLRSLQPVELRRLRRAIEAFPPRPIADFLISVCIRHGTDNFFYFDQSQFISDIDEFYTDANSELRSDCSFVGLALAVFALGSQWTILERPEGAASDATFSVDERDPGWMFYSHVKTLMPDLIEMPCLRSVQVPFIVGVYLMPASAVGSSYVYLGLALRKALAFDLHQSTDEAIIDEREREVRRRVWWSVYSLERYGSTCLPHRKSLDPPSLTYASRITSIKLNRPRAIGIENVVQPLPSPLSDMDDGASFNNIVHQRAFIRLVKILDCVADVGGPRGPHNADYVRRMETDLENWKKSLPPDFELDRIDPRASTYRVVFHLHMNYYYAWIVMGKMSVVTVVRNHLRRHLGTSGEGETVPPIDPIMQKLSAQCIDAAGEIIRLFKTITRTRNTCTTGFSFTDFQGCSIATIVTLLAGVLDRDSDYDARVDFGLGCLRNMAAGNMTAMVGVRFVEALRSITNEAVENVRARVSRASMPSATAAEYARWSQWLSTTKTSAGSGTSASLKQNSGGAREHIGTPEGHRALPKSLPVFKNGVGKDGVGWNEREGIDLLHDVSPTLTDPLLRPSNGLDDSEMYTAADETFTSLMNGDDQNLIMGLTGMDVLDFSELTSLL